MVVLLLIAAAIWYVRRDGGGLDSPENVRLTNAGANAVRVSWDKIQDAEGYRVLLDGEVVGNDLNTDETSVVLQNVPRGPRKVAVVAFKGDELATSQTATRNVAGADEVADELTLTAVTATPSPAPTNAPARTATRTATAAPRPAATRPAAPTPNPTSAPQANFNPYKSGYEQSCGPENNRMGGCFWDVGAMGVHSDILNREVVEIGIAKGVTINWNGKTSRAFQARDGKNRCSLVVLAPDMWFEDLNVIDGNVVVYKVSTADVAGWMKTLAVQAAQEQQANYGCPAKSYPNDIDFWTSSTQSPPCGVIGFANCSGTTGSQQPAAPVPTTAPAAPNAGTTCEDPETVNCKPRRASVDFGGRLDFAQDDPVAGRIIMIAGRRYNDCRFLHAPGPGTVEDGTSPPWKTEFDKHRDC